jgi:hypothetical protein
MGWIRDLFTTARGVSIANETYAIINRSYGIEKSGLGLDHMNRRILQMAPLLNNPYDLAMMEVFFEVKGLDLSNPTQLKLANHYLEVSRQIKERGLCDSDKYFNDIQDAIRSH